MAKIDITLFNSHWVYVDHRTLIHFLEYIFFVAFRHEVLSKGEPLSQDELKKQRNLRKQEMRAKQIFHEVILHIMFVIIVYCIGYVNRDNRAHAIISNLDNLLVTPSTDQIGFSQVFKSSFSFGRC